MQESVASFHHLEWPAPGARVRGPLLTLRGWAVGKPGGAIADIRARTPAHTALGLYGLPRTDLAAHFQSKQSWLPAEFVVVLPVADGTVSVVLEFMDVHGQWQLLREFSCTVSPDGESDPRIAGEFDAAHGWLGRSPHAPFHGHLDDPAAELNHGRATVFGWLLHAEQPIKTVFASTDLLVFNQLEHGLTDDSLAAKVPALPQARTARLRGTVDAPATLLAPACLRVYAQLADDSVHLCFARRFTPAQQPAAPLQLGQQIPRTPPVSLPPFPSGRPRRLLLATRNLHRDDATLRALDVGGFLVSSRRWAVRLVTTVDGPFRASFEAAGIPVQIVDPRHFFAAQTPADTETALATLARQIWWRHLDATVAFDSLCDWLLTLSRQHLVPAFADWPQSAADPQGDSVPNFSGAVSPWHSTGLLGAARDEIRQGLGIMAGTLMAVSPSASSPGHGGPQMLQAAAWLRLLAPARAARWRFDFLDGRDSTTARALRSDTALNQVPNFAVHDSITPNWLAAADLVCHAGDGPTTLRPLLDAAALGTPLVAGTGHGIAALLNSGAEIDLVSPNNPLALAHALIAHAANPDAAARRARAAQRRIREQHNPQRLLPLWQATLESALAANR
ncbi:MAG: glycosyltransferase [Opitutae bacterium]|nr:glycosyltransferase [Opitutae bacterium]